MEQQMTKSIKLFWIGILTCLSFILFFYGIKYLQNESFQQSTLSFKVIFKNSQGIDNGDEVRMLGKKIGYVRGTNIIGQNIILDVSINNMFKNSIPIDSRFEITSEDIMGGKYLTIYPGKDSNKFILDGDTVSGKNSEVVSLTQDIGDFARTLNETFGVEQKNQIIDAVESFNIFSNDLESFIANNKDIITNEDKENLHLILSNVNKVSNSLQLLIDEQSDNISTAIENISDFTMDLPEVSAKISALSVKVESMVDNINNGGGTLSKLIDDDELYKEFTSLVSNTNGLILEARSFTKDVQDNPKKYIKAYFAAKREDSKKK
tara:strand:+ start:2717 stop:3679 length:963 start_codon:yes stop_codon:yes gene_type:complete